MFGDDLYTTTGVSFWGTCIDDTAAAHLIQSCFFIEKIYILEER